MECSNGKIFEVVCKNIWADVNYSTRDSVNMNEITELAKQTGSDKLNVEYIKKMLQTTAENLTNYELKTLADEEHKNI